MAEPRAAKGSEAGQRGAALLMALATVSLLTVIAVELTGAVQDEVRLVEAFRDELRARWAARAPVALVAAALEEDDNSFAAATERWATLDERLEAGGAQVRFQVQDESAKVNLNAPAAQEPALRDGVMELLTGMFQERELDPQLVAYLADWVDADSEPRAEGSEGAFYRTLPQPYPVKNGPLDTLSELQLIRGFSPKALQALGFQSREGSPDPQSGDWLTIYSDGRINVNTADPFILRNLAGGLPEALVDALVELRADRPLERVEELRELPGMDDALYSKLSPLVTVDSQYFSVRSEAAAGRMRKRLSVVLRKEGGRVSVVYWRIS
ncbi:MAG: type II secretion system minor pseudopilin GspK [Nitrospinota bacterium]